MVDAWNLTVLQPYPATRTTGPVTGDMLLTRQPGEKAVLGAAATTDFVFDLGSSLPIRQAALLYTSLGAGAQVRITASDNANGLTGAVFDSGFMTLDALALAAPLGYRHFFHHLLGAGPSARYVRVSVVNPNGAAYAGRLVVGNPFQPEYNANLGDAAWGFEEADSPELLDSGVEVLYEGRAAPMFQFTLGWLTEAELEEEWLPLTRLQHEGEPVLVVKRPDPHTYRHSGLYYGLLRAKPPVAMEFDTYEAEASVRGML